MATQFYYCPICGNVIVKAVDGGTIPHCCGKEMQVLHANTEEGSAEKHIPEVSIHRAMFPCRDNMVVVKIGNEPHPMNKEHHIKFIYLETVNGGQIIHFDEFGPDTKAEAHFCLYDDKVLTVYSYCNLHGLWSMKVTCR